MTNPAHGADAVDISALPPGLDFYLGYIDGAWPNYNEVKARFPNARVLSVTTGGFNKADICDCEGGDYSPADAASGVMRGLWPTVYTTPGNVAAIARIIGQAKPWSWFAADWTGVEHIPAGAVACQWASPTVPPLGLRSTAYDWDVALASYINPRPPTPPIRKDIMPGATQGPNNTLVFDYVGADGHAYVFITDENGGNVNWRDLTAAVSAETQGKNVPTVQG